MQPSDPGEAAHPALQGVHADADAPAARLVPTGQGAHDDTLLVAAYEPPKQLVQLVDPGRENRPTGQALHEVLPGDTAIVPAAQAVQLADELEFE